MVVMEIIPSFSLYRGLYEFSQYAFTGSYMATSGMRWKDLNDSNNGLKEVLIIMFVEWVLLIFVAYQVASLGSGIRRHPLYFLPHFQKNRSPSFRKPNLQRQDSKVSIEMDKPDVAQEVLI